MADRQKQVCEDALFFLRAWNLAAADALFVEASRDFPAWTTPRDGQALTSVLMGDLDRATQHMADCLALEPRDALYPQLVRIERLSSIPLSRKNRGRVITAGKIVQALASKQQDQIAMHGAGVAFLVGDDYRLAETAFRAALGFGRENCPDCVGLSLAQASMGRHFDAWAAAVRGVRHIKPWTLLMPWHHLLSSVDTRFLGHALERFEAAVESGGVTPALQAILCIFRFYGGCHESAADSACLAAEYFRKINQPIQSSIMGLYESASNAFRAVKNASVGEALATLKKLYLKGSPYKPEDDHLIHEFVESCVLAVVDEALMSIIKQVREGRDQGRAAQIEACVQGLALLLNNGRVQAGGRKSSAGISVPVFYRMVLLGTIGGSVSCSLGNSRVKGLVSTTLRLRREVGIFAPLLINLERLGKVLAMVKEGEPGESPIGGKDWEGSTQGCRILADVSDSLIRQTKFLSEGYLSAEFSRSLKPAFETYAADDFYGELFPAVTRQVARMLMGSRLREEMVAGFWSNTDDVAVVVDGFLSEAGCHDG